MGIARRSAIEVLVMFLLCPVGMLMVFLGQIVGLVAITITSLFLQGRIMTPIFRKWTSWTGQIYDRKAVFLGTMCLTLILFGMLFAWFTGRSIKNHCYIRRGLFTCFMAGVTSLMCAGAVIVFEAFPDSAFLEMEDIIWNKPFLALSAMGIGIMFYYSGRWSAK